MFQYTERQGGERERKRKKDEVLTSSPSVVNVFLFSIVYCLQSMEAVNLSHGTVSAPMDVKVSINKKWSAVRVICVL